MRSELAEASVRKWLKVVRFDIPCLTSVPKTAVYENYKTWCAENNVFIYTLVPFATALLKIVPNLGHTHPRMNGNRVRCYIFPPTDDFDDLL